jgi:hypothetical protein
MGPKRNATRNTSTDEIRVFLVTYRKRQRVRFPPPPLGVLSPNVHRWPALSRNQRDRAGLLHARGRGQPGTRGDSRGPKSNTSRNTSARYSGDSALRVLGTLKNDTRFRMSPFEDRATINPVVTSTKCGLSRQGCKLAYEDAGFYHCSLFRFAISASKATKVGTVAPGSGTGGINLATNKS